MDLSIIIVSYNTRDLLLRCLKSLPSAQGSALNSEVIVVDNNSADDSPKAVKQTFPQVRLISNGKNLGFGPANNLGAAAAQGKYLLFLNSDTVCPKSSLSSLLAQAQHCRAKLATCRLLSPDGRLQPQGGYLPNLLNLTAWQLFLDDLPVINRFFPAYQLRHPAWFAADRRPGWIAGTVMLVELQLFHTLHGFDPHIFMYGEDVDFCRRAQIAGVRPYYFHTPAVTHLGQGSGSSITAIIGEYQYLNRYAGANLPGYQQVYLKWLFRIGALVRYVLFGKIGGHESKAQAYRQVFKMV